MSIDEGFIIHTAEQRQSCRAFCRYWEPTDPAGQTLPGDHAYVFYSGTGKDDGHHRRAARVRGHEQWARQVPDFKG
jgi:hypothetical protein